VAPMSLFRFVGLVSRFVSKSPNPYFSPRILPSYDLFMHRRILTLPLPFAPNVLAYLYNEVGLSFPPIETWSLTRRTDSWSDVGAPPPPLLVLTPCPQVAPWVNLAQIPTLLSVSGVLASLQRNQLCFVQPDTFYFLVDSSIFPFLRFYDVAPQLLCIFAPLDFLLWFLFGPFPTPPPRQFSF